VTPYRFHALAIQIFSSSPHPTVQSRVKIIFLIKKETMKKNYSEWYEDIE